MDRVDHDTELGLRPLTARSVIASALLGTHPPELPTPVLVAAAQLFGVSESAARTALSRLVAAGELVVEDGSYRLVGDLLERQHRQDVGRSAEVGDWDGSWLMVILGGTGRSAAERARRRTDLGRARLAEAREGVWVRPDNLGPFAPPPVADLTVGRFVPDGSHGEEWRNGGLLDVGGLWDLASWQRQADGLRDEVARLTPGLEAGDDELLARGFVVSAAVTRLLQSDPLLPDALLPIDWSGRGLRTDYDRFDLAYRAVLRDWLRGRP